MKTKNKVYIFLLITLLFVAYHYYRFYNYKIFIKSISENHEVHLLEDFLSSYFVFRAELPEKNRISEFIDSKLPNIKKYGYDVSLSSSKDSVTVYSYGIDKTDNHLKKATYFMEYFDYSINDYLKKVNEDLILISYKIEKGCNSTDLETLNLFDDEDKFIKDVSLEIEVKKELNRIELIESVSSKSNSMVRTLLFKYGDGKVSCLCDSGVNFKLIKSLEKKLIYFFNNNTYGIDKAVFTIKLRLLKNNLTDLRNEEIFRTQ